jgi:hypothetical protein
MSIRDEDKLHIARVAKKMQNESSSDRNAWNFEIFVAAWDKDGDNKQSK